MARHSSPLPTGTEVARYGSGSRSGNGVDTGGKSRLQFPNKLHMMLERAEADGASNIVSWLPHGRAFQVHNKGQFVEEIMPSYFNSSKYKSFQRNLNLWGFETATQGPDKGSIFHRCFVRHNPALCDKMIRQKIKGNSSNNSNSAVGETGTSAAASAVAGRYHSLLSRADLSSNTHRTYQALSNALGDRTCVSSSTSGATPGEAGGTSITEGEDSELPNTAPLKNACGPRSAPPGLTTLSSLYAQAGWDTNTQLHTHTHTQLGTVVGDKPCYEKSTENTGSPEGAYVDVDTEAAATAIAQVSSQTLPLHPPHRTLRSRSHSPTQTNNSTQQQQKYYQQHDKAPRTTFPHLRLEQVQEFESLQHEEQLLQLKLHQNRLKQRRLFEEVAARASAQQYSKSSSPNVATPVPVIANTKSENAGLLLGLDAIAAAAAFVPLVDSNDGQHTLELAEPRRYSENNHVSDSDSSASGVSSGDSLLLRNMANGSNGIGNVSPAALMAFCAGTEMTRHSWLSSREERKVDVAAVQ